MKIVRQDKKLSRRPRRPLREAYLEQVSEIFDAEAPHHPRGGYGQAWSVAELMRALVEDIGIQARGTRVALKRIVERQRKEKTSPSTQRKRTKSLGRGEDASINP